VPPPPAVVIRRRARPGRDAALAAVVRAMMLADRAFPGHMSSDMIRLRAPAGEWLLILRFDSRSALNRWAASGITLEWWAQAERLTQPAQVDRAHGRENWSTLPGRVDAPPRWKMALATALGIYPLVLFLFPLLAAFTAGLPSWLAGLVTVAVAISLMTWGVMPLLTCLLHGWLFGHPSRACACRGQASECRRCVVAVSALISTVITPAALIAVSPPAAGAPPHPRRRLRPVMLTASPTT